MSAPEIPAGWSVVEGALQRDYRCADFAAAMALANAIAVLAEAQNHHPELTVSWGRVRVRTWSHDAGAVTARDTALATAIDRERA